MFKLLYSLIHCLSQMKLRVNVHLLEIATWINLDYVLHWDMSITVCLNFIVDRGSCVQNFECIVEFLKLAYLLLIENLYVVEIMVFFFELDTNVYFINALNFLILFILGKLNPHFGNLYFLNLYNNCRIFMINLYQFTNFNY